MSHTSFAQIDTSLQFVRKGINNTLPFRIFTSNEQLKNIGGTNLPLYTMTEKHFNRVKSLLETYIN